MSAQPDQPIYALVICAGLSGAREVMSFQRDYESQGLQNAGQH